MSSLALYAMEADGSCPRLVPDAFGFVDVVATRQSRGHGPGSLPAMPGLAPLAGTVLVIAILDAIRIWITT